MKTIKSLIKVTLLFPCLTLAESKFTQTETQNILQSKLGSTKAHESGVLIRPVSKDLVNEAIQKLGGNANVQFSDRDSMKFRLSSGVIIGNGGSGLIATSNMDQSGPVVVQPPLSPKTSITVVGKLDVSQGDQYCIAKFKTDQTGTQILVGQGFNFNLDNQCAKIGQPVRVRDRGLYLVYIPIRGHDSLGNAKRIELINSIIVTIENNENKVLPLREIHVPPTSSEINFRVLSEITSPQVYDRFLKILKSIVDLHTNRNNTFYNEYINSVDLRKICPADYKNNEVSCKGEYNTFKFNDLNNGHIAPSNGFLIFSNSVIGSTSQGRSISVFPGSYQIEWTIDGQKDFTTGIVVE